MNEVSQETKTKRAKLVQALSNFKQNIITLMHCDFILKWILVISELRYKNKTDCKKKTNKGKQFSLVQMKLTRVSSSKKLPSLNSKKNLFS